MSHLRPIGQFRRHGFCFSHGLVMQFSFRPQRCTDAASWTEFLSAIGEPFHLLTYTGYCSYMSFLTHVPSLDFIPLLGLRGVTTYHPLAVMGQFDQIQELHLYEGTSDYRFLISLRTEAELLRVHDLWSHRVFAEFTVNCPGQTPAYLEWLHRDLDTARFDQTDVGVISRGAFSYEASSVVEVLPASSELVARPDVDGLPTFTHAFCLDSEDCVQRLVAGDSQLRSALRDTEIARDTAYAERDAAILARDAALAARDDIALQVRVLMEAHSETVRSATALLTRIDMMGRQIAGGADTSDTFVTLSLLLQLISDL